MNYNTTGTGDDATGQNISMRFDLANIESKQINLHIKKVVTIGSAVFFGLSFPRWLAQHPEVIRN